MRWLLVGAVVLIVASGATLVMGWSTTNEPLIWGSIIASGAAAIALIVAFVVGRGEWKQRPARPVTVEPQPPTTAETLPSVASEPLPVLTSSPRRRAAPTRPRAAAKPQSTSYGVGGGRDEVVAIPERKKYHRADCRYAQAKGAERITKAAARRRKFAPCGICKP